MKTEKTANSMTPHRDKRISVKRLLNHSLRDGFFEILPIMLILWVLFFGSADAFQLIHGKPATSSDCPAGTYVFYWDGEHSNGTGYACYDNGASNENYDSIGANIIIDGTAALEGSYGANLPAIANNQAIIWLHDNNNLDVSGTIQTLISIPTTVDDHMIGAVHNSGLPGADHAVAYITNQPRASGKYNGVTSVTSETINTATTYTACYTWRNTGTEKHCASVAAGDVACSFVEADCDTETLTDWTNTGIDSILIGEGTNHSILHDQTIYIDKFRVREGYEGP